VKKTKLDRDVYINFVSQSKFIDHSKITKLCFLMST